MVDKNLKVNNFIAIGAARDLGHSKLLGEELQ